MREEEKESLALEAAAAAAAVAEGRIREEAVVLKAAMVVGAGVDGDSVRLSDSRSAIWNGTGLIPLFILSFCFGLNLDGPISI